MHAAKGVPLHASSEAPASSPRATPAAPSVECRMWLAPSDAMNAVRSTSTRRWYDEIDGCTRPATARSRRISDTHAEVSSPSSALAKANWAQSKCSRAQSDYARSALNKSSRSKICRDERTAVTMMPSKPALKGAVGRARCPRARWLAPTFFADINPKKG